MNRRKFFSSLGIGLLAAPQIVKALTESEPKISYAGPRIFVLDGGKQRLRVYGGAAEYQGELQWCHIRDNYSAWRDATREVSFAVPASWSDEKIARFTAT